jgi:hypothetical protein
MPVSKTLGNTYDRCYSEWAVEKPEVGIKQHESKKQGEMI